MEGGLASGQGQGIVSGRSFAHSGGYSRGCPHRLSIDNQWNEIACRIFGVPIRGVDFLVFGSSCSSRGFGKILLFRFNAGHPFQGVHGGPRGTQESGKFRPGFGKIHVVQRVLLGEWPLGEERATCLARPLCDRSHGLGWRRI